MRLRVFIALVLGMYLLPLGVSPTAARAQPSPHPFEIVPGSFDLTPSTDQAGAHENLTVAFDFAHEQNKSERTYNDVKDTVVNLPAGFAGNNTAVPTCTAAQLLSGSFQRTECPPDTQVGTISFTEDATEPTPAKVLAPLYNMEVISPGVTAMLGFRVTSIVQNLPVTVRPGDTGITVTSPSILGTGEFHDVSVTTWGVPASHEHDAQRGETCGLGGNRNECTLGDEEVNIPAKPFLSNPTSCGSHLATMRANSWEHPEEWSEAQVEVAPTTGCERVPFEPSIEASPTTRSAEAATGLNVSLLVPQTWENPLTLATSDLKDATVALPEGVTINPGAGSGLGACTPAQYETETFSSPPGEGCPRIEDRLDRNRNAAARGRDSRRGVCRHAV